MNQRIVIKAGYLKKQPHGSGLLKRPNKRWFVFTLFSGLPSLEYYESLQSAAVDPPINSFDLRGCHRVIVSPEDPLAFTFSLHDRVVLLTADSVAEADDWVDTFNRNLPQLSQKVKPENVYAFEDDDDEETMDDEHVKELAKAGIVLNGSVDNTNSGRQTTAVSKQIDKLAKKIYEKKGDVSEVAEFQNELDDSVYCLTELGDMDDESYALLEKKCRELEDWSALSDLRNHRNKSTVAISRPNPDPPLYVHTMDPMKVAGFFDDKKLSGDHGDDGKLYVNPLGPSSPILTPYATYVETMKRQILYPGGIAVCCKSRDIYNHLAVVCISGRLFVVGWNRCATRLHSCFHVGDQVMAVDGARPESLEIFYRMVEGSSDKIQIRLRRLPHGKVFCVKRQNGQSLGVQMNSHKSEIVHVQPESLAAAHGLSHRTISFFDDCQLVTWSITEINSRPLKLWPEPREVEIRLNAHGQEINLVVQPTDFVKALKKQLKRIKDYKKFLVQ